MHLLGSATRSAVCRPCIGSRWVFSAVRVIGPILWGHSGPLCHAMSLLSLLLALWTSILHCHSPGVATVARRLRYSYRWLRLILVVVSTVATPGEWQCKIRTGGVRRLAVANGPSIFQMLLVAGICRYCSDFRVYALTIVAVVAVSTDGSAARQSDFRRRLPWIFGDSFFTCDAIRNRIQHRNAIQTQYGSFSVCL